MRNENVIGPITRAEWNTLRDVRELIEVLKTTPDPKGLIAEGIQKEQEIYNYVLQPKLTRNRAA